MNKILSDFKKIMGERENNQNSQESVVDRDMIKLVSQMYGRSYEETEKMLVGVARVWEERWNEALKSADEIYRRNQQRRGERYSE